MDCDYELVGTCDRGNLFVCRRPGCRHQRCSKQTDPKMLKRNCGAAPPPVFFRRVLNFSKALVHHVANFMPVCTQEQIDARAAICRSCPLFDPQAEICTHKKCGCGINDQHGFFNKLSWADQQCPDDPPRWLRLD